MDQMHKRSISFQLRMIHNKVKDVIAKSGPKFETVPQSQLQGGIMGYLFHHDDQPVYQKDIEKEFHISRATATNTLQVMEKNGLIVRRSLDKDARLKRILMTEEAARNHALVEAHMKMMNDRMLQGLDETEIEDLTRMLRVIMCNLDELSREYTRENP